MTKLRVPAAFCAGVAVTSAVFLLAGAGPRDAGPQAGRYQVAASENHAFVIDTATGKVWPRFGPVGRTDPEFYDEKRDGR